MEIKIDKQTSLFSHRMGISTPIPGTFWCVSVYPTCLHFFRKKIFEDTATLEFFLDVKGPWKDFTIIQDVEKGRITVFGESSYYFRYHIQAKLGQMTILFDKVPQDGMFFSHVNKVVNSKEEVSLFSIEEPLWTCPHSEVLSLGMHKDIEMDGIYKRSDMNEILPLWFRLGSQVPPSQGTGGTASLFDSLHKVAAEKRKDQVEKILYLIWKSSFLGMFEPSLEDTLCQGLFEKCPINKTDSPFVILSKGSEWIRSLFFVSKNHSLSFLPLRPASIWCGRMNNLLTDYGTLHFEWTKKRMRRVIFSPSNDNELEWFFPADVETYRVRTSRKDKGRVYGNGDKWSSQKGKTYYFDHFQK